MVTLEPMDEQVIVVTGASSGIELMAARTALRRSARPVLAGPKASALCAASEREPGLSP
jgi:NAD(P)-dependent dehydrogenase (short-subunit alcohol dehydrogenase family)